MKSSEQADGLRVVRWAEGGVWIVPDHRIWLVPNIGVVLSEGRRSRHRYRSWGRLMAVFGTHGALNDVALKS